MDFHMLDATCSRNRLRFTTILQHTITLIVNSYIFSCALGMHTPCVFTRGFVFLYSIGIEHSIYTVKLQDAYSTK